MQNGFVAAANYQAEGRIPTVETGSEKAVFIIVFAMVDEKPKSRRSIRWN
jgi:hypothetical protein